MVCNDTIESIIAEMREFADTESQSIGRDVLRREIQYFAERIEATHKLELEDCSLRVAPIVRAETKAECQREVAHERENALNTKSPENVNSERVIYNAAKIRFVDVDGIYINPQNVEVVYYGNYHIKIRTISGITFDVSDCGNYRTALKEIVNKLQGEDNERK